MSRGSRSQPSCRPYPGAVLIGMVVAGCAAAGAAQQREPDAFLNQQRALDESVAGLQAEQEGVDPSLRFDYGGWYSFHFLIFDDGVESSRTLRRHDMRAWARAVLDGGAHEFYLRGRLSLLDYNSGDSYDGNDDDVEGPNLERGYYRFNLSRAADAYGWSPPGIDATVTLGRDLVEFGSGFALSEPLDHVAVALSTEQFQLTGLAGQMVGSRPDFDASRITTRTRRAFFGAELRWTALERHEPFAYVLWQRDHNRDEYPSLLQDFDYDSFYVGLGSTGEIVKGLRYVGEWVYESGHSFGHRSFLDADVIRAWAFDAELEYLFSGPRRSRASIEYIFASGDGDRLDSPTNSVGGNRCDDTDNGFVGFGYRDTGLSFAPRYSNLHMWRAGASTFPWPDDPRLAQLELGTNVFLYYKNHRRGAVSDPTADLRSGYLGWELDGYANWAITPDVAWTARLGVFFPGDAFSDRTTRTFFVTGVTWSF